MKKTLLAFVLLAAAAIAGGAIWHYFGPLPVGATDTVIEWRLRGTWLWEGPGGAVVFVMRGKQGYCGRGEDSGALHLYRARLGREKWGEPLEVRLVSTQSTESVSCTIALDWPLLDDERDLTSIRLAHVTGSAAWRGIALPVDLGHGAPTTQLAMRVARAVAELENP